MIRAGLMVLVLVASACAPEATEPEMGGVAGAVAAPLLDSRYPTCWMAAGVAQADPGGSVDNARITGGGVNRTISIQSQAAVWASALGRDGYDCHNYPSDANNRGTICVPTGSQYAVLWVSSDLTHTACSGGGRNEIWKTYQCGGNFSTGITNSTCISDIAASGYLNRPTQKHTDAVTHNLVSDWVEAGDTYIYQGCSSDGRFANSEVWVDAHVPMAHTWAKFVPETWAAVCACPANNCN